MNLRSKKPGDLIYVPSEVILHNFTSLKKLKQPTHLLITAVNDNEPMYYRVVYKGIEWLLNRNDAYEPEGAQ